MLQSHLKVIIGNLTLFRCSKTLFKNAAERQCKTLNEKLKKSLELRIDQENVKIPQDKNRRDNLSCLSKGDTEGAGIGCKSNDRQLRDTI
jgi:hypothetical protein